MCRVRVIFALLVILSLAGCQSAPRESANPSVSSVDTKADSGPRRDLSRDEEAGGHTLRKHAGRSDEQLRERLRREPNIAAASTYTDRETAERAVGTALQDNQSKVQRWLERRGGHPNLVLDYDSDASHPVGRTLRRGENRAEPCSHAVVVLRWAGDHDYYVLTSYPECR